MAKANRCPSCGEHVSPFAAGCARCGAALDPNRGRYQSPAQRARSLWVALLRLIPRLPFPSRRKS